MGILLKTEFQIPSKISPNPFSRSSWSSPKISLAFWFKNIENEAESTLLPLNKLSRWILIPPTLNFTFIWSILITSWKSWMTVNVKLLQAQFKAHLRHVSQADFREDARFDIFQQNVDISRTDQRQQQDISCNQTSSFHVLMICHWPHLSSCMLH